jgi:hypothetical protein
MTGRARLWLAAVAIALAAVVVVSRAQSLRASANTTSALATQTMSLRQELRDGQDALAAALRDVDNGRFDEADHQLIRARIVLGHTHEQLLSLGLSNESGHVLALLEGIEVARGLIVRVSIVQMSAGAPHQP